MTKTIRIDDKDIVIDENYYILYKILQEILTELRRGR